MGWRAHSAGVCIFSEGLLCLTLRRSQNRNGKYLDNLLSDLHWISSRIQYRVAVHQNRTYCVDLVTGKAWRSLRRLDTASGAAGEENTPVECRVVSRDELGAVNPIAQNRPKLTEGWRIAYVLPCEAMDSGEHEVRARWQARTILSRYHRTIIASAK